MLTMLAGGTTWYGYVPAMLVALSAIFAFIPSSRIAGIAAGVLWSLFALIGTLNYKYFGPLRFGALARSSSR